MIAIFIVGTFLIHMHERVLILPYELTVSLSCTNRITPSPAAHVSCANLSS